MADHDLSTSDSGHVSAVRRVACGATLALTFLGIGGALAGPAAAAGGAPPPPPSKTVLNHQLHQAKAAARSMEQAGQQIIASKTPQPGTDGKTPSEIIGQQIIPPHESATEILASNAKYMELIALGGGVAALGIAGAIVLGMRRQDLAAKGVITSEGTAAQNQVNDSISRHQRLTSTSAQRNENQEIRFSDVAGIDGAKESLREIVAFLKNPAKFHKYGAKVPSGVLLYGPPGTGKTLLTKAVAGEAGAPFFAMSGSGFVEMFVGVGAARARNLWKEAQAAMRLEARREAHAEFGLDEEGKPLETTTDRKGNKKPVALKRGQNETEVEAYTQHLLQRKAAIIFIDEIDAVGRARNNGPGSNDERENTLNELLVQMDGYDPTQGKVIVIGATNRLDMLDDALLRPGRFDRKVEVHLPDIKGRREILEVHSRGKPVDTALLDEYAVKTWGMAGADLENLMNEAALIAADRDEGFISAADLHEAYMQVQVGRETNHEISERDRVRTAYHEAAHAVVAHVTEDNSPKLISIAPRGQALGVMMNAPETHEVSKTFAQMKSMLQTFIAGRLAEEIIGGAEEVTTGASNDIERMTEIAQRMVREFGWTGEDKPTRAYPRANRQGMPTADSDPDVEHRVDRILLDAERDTKALLCSERELLDAVAQRLLEKETIDGNEFNELAAQYGRSAPPAPHPFDVPASLALT